MPDQDNPKNKDQDSGLGALPVAGVVQPVPDPSNPNPKLNKPDDVERPMSRYERRSLLVSIVGIVIGVIVAVIYGLQLGQMRKATEISDTTSRSLERARISVGMFLEPPKPPNNPSIIRFEFNNVGRSHGTVTKHVTKKMIGTEADLPERPDYSGATEKKLLMGLALQGDKARDEFSYPEGVGWDLRMLETQGRFLIVWGYIEYVDTFKEHHTTRFAGVFFPSKSMFKIVDNQNYLESD
jgi:hypothetical protein